MDIPSNATALRRRCQYLYRSWWMAHYSIGVIGILCAATLTALTPAGSSIEGNAVISLAEIRPNAWLLGVAATVCGSLVTLLGPIQKAEKYWSAFHLLDQAIMEFEVDLIDMGEFARRISGARKVLQIGEIVDEHSHGANKRIQSDSQNR